MRSVSVIAGVVGVEMARRRRQVDRLDRIAGDELDDVEALGQPQQVAVILEVAGPAAAIEVADVGRAGDGAEDRRGRRRRSRLCAGLRAWSVTRAGALATSSSDQAAVEAHALAAGLDLGAGGAPAAPAPRRRGTPCRSPRGCAARRRGSPRAARRSAPRSADRDCGADARAAATACPPCAAACSNSRAMLCPASPPVEIAPHIRRCWRSARSPIRPPVGDSRLAGRRLARRLPIRGMNPMSSERTAVCRRTRVRREPRSHHQQIESATIEFVTAILFDRTRSSPARQAEARWRRLMPGARGVVRRRGSAS